MPPTAAVPAWATSGAFSSVTRTPDELSLLCPLRSVPGDVAAVGPFRALGLSGPIPVETVGVMASLVGPLAAAEVSVLAVATHDTDWLLVRHEELERAIAALVAHGHRVERPVGRVTHVHVAAKSRGPLVALETARLVGDLGIEGDRNAVAGKADQVTVVFAEEIAAAARALGAPIAPGSTRRNVTVEGLGGAPPVGARIRLGDALLEVTEPAEPCRLMETTVGPGARQALVHRGGVRCRALAGGQLRAGTPVTIEIG